MRRVPLTLLVTALLAPGVAAAQQGTQPRVEITPTVGFRIGGSLENETTGQSADIPSDVTWGATLEAYTGSALRFTMVFSRLQTDVDHAGGTSWFRIDYLQGGASRDLKSSGTMRPFVTGMLGVTIAKAEGTQIDSDTRFSLGASLGARTANAGRLGLKVEARGYLTFASTDGAGGTCGGTGCDLGWSGSALFQAEFLLGASLRF